MMNYLWSFLIIFSFISAIFTNSMQDFSSSFLSAGIDAINLSIRLLGMLCLWSGLMNIAEKSGLTALVAKLLSPILKRIFRQSKDRPEIMQAISMNITANLLGLGNAATPLGIEAMRRIQQTNKSTTASYDMIKFVVINTAAIRLIPTTVAVIRQTYGAKNPMDIMPVAWLVSTVSLVVGLGFAELFQLREEQKIKAYKRRDKDLKNKPILKNILIKAGLKSGKA